MEQAVLNGWLRIFKRQRREQEMVNSMYSLLVSKGSCLFVTIIGACRSGIFSSPLLPHWQYCFLQMDFEVVEEIIYGLESGILFGYDFLLLDLCRYCVIVAFWMIHQFVPYGHCHNLGKIALLTFETWPLITSGLIKIGWNFLYSWWLY